MQKYFALRLLPAGLTLSLGFALTGCPTPEATTDGGSTTSLECGAGTVAENGVCVIEDPQNTPDAGPAGPTLECGTGTVPNITNTQCVPDLECAAGTTENVDGTGCIAECVSPFSYDTEVSACACPAGLRPTDDGSDCEVDPALCGEGTVYQDGSCRAITPPAASDDETVAEDYVEIVLEEGKALDFGGVIGPIDRSAGPDFDRWRITTDAAKTRVQIQLISFGLPNGMFTLRALDTDKGEYFRAALPLDNRRAVREFVLPFAGTYEIMVSDVANFTNGFPVGSEDANYQIVVEQLLDRDATVLDGSDVEQNGVFDNADSYVVDPAVHAESAILSLGLKQFDRDPTCDTQQIAWFLDASGNYREYSSFRNGQCVGDVQAFILQQAAGTEVFVDYALRAGFQARYPYALSFQGYGDSAGPEANGDALDVNTNDRDFSFFTLETTDNTVYRARMQLPAASTLNASFSVVNADLVEMATSSTVTVDGASVEELKFFVKSGESGTWRLVINDNGQAGAFDEPNNNARLSVVSEVVTNIVQANVAAPVLSTLNAPTDISLNGWTSPWTLVEVNDIGQLNLRTQNGVRFRAYDVDDMSSFDSDSGAQKPDLNVNPLEEGCATPVALSAGAPILLHSGTYTAVLGAVLNDDFRDTEFANCGRAGKDVYWHIPAQAAGTVLTASVSSALENAGTDTTLALIRSPECTETTATCVAIEDNGSADSSEELTYTFDGTEGPLLLVVDSLAANQELVEGDLVLDFDLDTGGDYTRDFNLLPGQSFLVRAYNGAAEGSFTQIATMASSPYAWEQEPNDDVSGAEDLPVMPSVGTVGECNFGGEVITESGSYLLYSDGSDSFESGDWDGCSNSGSDVQVVLPQQPAGTVMVLETTQGATNSADTTLNLIQTITCVAEDAVCLEDDDDGGDEYRYSKLTYTWTGDEGDLLVVVDSWSFNALSDGVQLNVQFGDDALAPNVSGISGADDVDYWRMDVASTGLLSVVATEGPLGNQNGVLALSVVDAQGDTVFAAFEGDLALGLSGFVEAGTYYAVVRHISGPAVDYTLSWTLNNNIAFPSTCEEPMQITGAGVYTGDTTRSLDSYDGTQGCLIGPQTSPISYADSPDDLWSVVIPAGETLVATLTSDFNAALVLVEDCVGACLDSSDVGFASNTTEEVSFTNTSGGNLSVMLVVTGFEGDKGAYEMNISVASPICFPGQTRCDDNTGSLETCNVTGDAYDVTDCPGGCGVNAFEQIATCNAYCGAGTDRAANSCDGNDLVACSADQTRYLDGATCDVACSVILDDDGYAADALCTFDVCDYTQPSTCAVQTINGDSVAVTSTCDATAANVGQIGCAYGCNADATDCQDATAPATTDLSGTVATSYGACGDSPSATDIVDESGTFVLALNGNGFADATPCGLDGDDGYFRLPAQPAGTSVQVTATSEFDVSVGFLTACDDAACLQQDNPGDTTAESTYVFTGDETEVLVVVDTTADVAITNMDVDVAVEYTQAAANLPVICQADAMACVSGSLTACNAEGTEESTGYCDFGCNDAADACLSYCAAQTPTVVAAGITTETDVPVITGRNDYSRTCGGNRTNDELVYVLTPDVDGLLSLKETSSGDAVVEVRTACDATTAVDCNDFGDVAEINARAGETYVFIVEWYSATNTALADIEIELVPFETCFPSEGTCNPTANQEELCNAEGTAFETTACDFGCNGDNSACATYCETLTPTEVSEGTTSSTLAFGDLLNESAQSCSTSNDNPEGTFVLSVPTEGYLTVEVTNGDAVVEARESCTAPSALDCNDSPDSATVLATPGVAYAFTTEWWSSSKTTDMDVDIIFEPIICVAGEGTCDAITGESVCNERGTAVEVNACAFGCSGTQCATACEQLVVEEVSVGVTSRTVAFADFVNDYSFTCGSSFNDSKETSFLFTVPVAGTLTLEVVIGDAVVEARLGGCDAVESATLDCNDSPNSATVDAVPGETYHFMAEWYYTSNSDDMGVDITFTPN